MGLILIIVSLNALVSLWSLSLILNYQKYRLPFNPTQIEGKLLTRRPKFRVYTNEDENDKK